MPDQNKPTDILMIENDPLDAELCAHALKKAGMSVRTEVVQTLEEFQLKIKGGRYDLILTDYNLAGWTGLEAFDYSRRHGCEIPFILVTGAVGEEVAVECIKRGISDYVLKDRLARLPIAAQRALEEKSLRQARTQEEEQAREKERRLNEELERRVIERTAQLEAVNRDLRTEVSERKRAEEILRESQERFRLLADGVKDYAITMLDPQGRVVSWNSGGERIQGYRAEEIIGSHFSRFYTREAVERGDPGNDLWLAAVEGRLEGERSSVRKDGSVFLASVILTALHDASGRLRGFSKVCRDITDQRRAQKALERLRLQQQLILNSAGDGICGLDESGICTFINPAGASMAGSKPEDLIGKSMRNMLLSRPPEDGVPSEGDCPIQVALKEGTEFHADGAVLVRKDGTTLAVECVVTPILGEVKGSLGAVLVFHDVTARRAVEKMKNEFVSIVSHEVRTPLTAIRGVLGLLATGKLCQAAGKCQPMIKVGMENTDRLARLVSDILDLERIESGKARIEKKQCDASTLLEQAVALMRVAAASHGIMIAISARPIFFQVDPDQIIQVLINLLNNAIKFSPSGSTVRVTVDQIDGEVLFQVKDPGRGIPVDKLTQVFERFQQVDAGDSREKGGTGLGLAICRSIVAQHNGRIWAESKLGQGSAFFFSLPVRTQ
ncbi:MAG: PAS domain S-box protein [Terriglobia bacterium]